MLKKVPPYWRAPKWSVRNATANSARHKRDDVGPESRPQKAGRNGFFNGRQREFPQPKIVRPLQTIPPEQLKLSLADQLFPEESSHPNTAQPRLQREIPRLPLFENQYIEDVPPRDDTDELDHTPVARMLHDQDARKQEISVLIIRQASNNLVEEDFRRLVPQGRHMEGWTLEQSDIIKVIPARSMTNLAQDHRYFILFNSKLGAFKYQTHVRKMFEIVSQYTTISLSSEIPPPQGYMVDGMDAHATIQAFTLIPASQQMELRQLKPPLTPVMESLVRHQGYEALLERPNKMPFEVRLTFDGPQLPIGTIRYILHESGRDRSLGWSGGERTLPKLSLWQPQYLPADTDNTSRGAQSIQRKTELLSMEQRMHIQDLQRQRSATAWDPQLPHRTPRLVYIVGFYTELAAQRFLQYWHRRPMVWGDVGRWDEDDDPPIANVEMLW